MGCHRTCRLTDALRMKNKDIISELQRFDADAEVVVMFRHDEGKTRQEDFCVEPDNGPRSSVAIFVPEDDELAAKLADCEEDNERLTNQNEKVKSKLDRIEKIVEAQTSEAIKQILNED